MSVRSVIKVTERYVIDNAPTLLTAIAVTGTLTTAYLTGKATFKAADIIREEEERRELLEPAVLEVLPELDVKQKTRLVWKQYIPPAISVVTTVGCMVMANSISSSRLAAIAAAYAVSDKNFTEYKDKVKEMFGEKKSGEVRTAVAQDHVNNNPPTEHNVIKAHGGNTLCLDKWTGRYFTSDMQTIRAAENDFAKGLYKGSDVVTLDDFYEALGIPIPKCADNFGWNQDSPIDLTFDSVIHEGEPVLVMDFANAPFPIGGYFGHA
jgi:hypothetical protein